MAAILFVTRAVDQCHFNFILFLRVYTEIALPLLVGCRSGFYLFSIQCGFRLHVPKKREEKTPPEVSLLCGQVILI